MLKTILTAFVFPLFLLFGPIAIGSSHTEKSAASQSMSGSNTARVSRHHFQNLW